MMNGEITNEQLREIVIAKRGKLTLQKYAKTLGVSFQFLGKVLLGEYAPGPTIAKRLGYDQVITVTFRKRKPRKKPKDTLEKKLLKVVAKDFRAAKKARA